MDLSFLTCEQVEPSKWEPRFYEARFLESVGCSHLAGQAYGLEFAPEPDAHSKQLWRIDCPMPGSGFRLTMTEWMFLDGGFEPTHMLEIVFDHNGTFLGAGRFLAMNTEAGEIFQDDPDLEIICSIWEDLGGLNEPTQIDIPPADLD